MALAKREKLLGIIVAGLLVLVVGQFLFGQFLGLFSDRETKLEAIQKEVDEKQAKIDRGRKAAARLADYERRSLPASRELARSLYQDWLLSLIDKHKIQRADVSLQPTTDKGAFDRLTFTLGGRGTVDQLAHLLYDFYSASHLQQIRRMTVKPLQEGQLELSATIEALVLPGAKRKDKLNDEPSGRLALSDFAKYQAAIVGRNFFAEYTPPKPTVVERPKVDPPKPPAFDAAKHAVITAIIEVNHQPEIWLSVRTTGKTLRLREGETFEVGALSGTVVRIGDRDAELEAGGKRLLVSLGESLREAAEIPSGEL